MSRPAPKLTRGMTAKTLRRYDSGRPATRVEYCRGAGCGLPHPEDVMEDGVCPACSESQAACEHCGVVCDRALMERIAPHDLVCRECADEEHAAREADEGRYTGPVSEAEGW